jgi:hypothetical protein
MTIKRWSAKRDANEPEIVSTLEAMGCKVERQDGGGGRPDLKITFPWDKTALVEVKMPGAKLNVKQKEYHAASAEPIHIVRNAREAINLFIWRQGIDVTP